MNTDPSALMTEPEEGYVKTAAYNYGEFMVSFLEAVDGWNRYQIKIEFRS